MKEHNKESATTKEQFGQELIGLLGEYAGQEERTLISGLMSWRAPEPAKAQDLLQPGSPLLSNLESHILALHREELGLLLTEACLRKFLHAQQGRIGGAPFLNPIDRAKGETPREFGAWKEAAAIVRERIPFEEDLAAPLEVLDRLMESPGGGGAGLLATAAAGFAIRPSETLSMYLGHGAEAEGNLVEAERTFRKIHEQPHNYRNSLVAAGDLGRLALGAGHPGEAVEWYKRAATGDEIYPLFAASWAGTALLNGNQHAWKEALTELGQRYDAQDPIFDVYCQRIRADRLAGIWTLDSKASAFARRANPGEFEHVQKIRLVFQ